MQVQENEVAMVRDLVEYDALMRRKQDMYEKQLDMERGRRLRQPKVGLQARHSLSKRRGH